MRTLAVIVLSVIIAGSVAAADEREEMVQLLNRIGLPDDIFTASKSTEGKIIIRPIEDEITEEVYLIDLDIPNQISFQDVTFKNKVLIQQTTFNSTVYFMNATFEKEAIFFDCAFKGRIYFNNTVFKKEASYLRSKFDEKVEYKATNFNSTANFIETIFNSVADFSQTTFTGKSDFSYAAFHHKSVDFSNAKFKDNIIVYEAKMPKQIYLKNVILEKELDLTAIAKKEPNQKCDIYLYGTDVNKVRLNYRQFKLAFEEEYGFDQKSNVYYSLLKKQRNDGFTKSYEILDIEYQKIYHYDGIEKGYLYWINKWWWNFGYNKERIFLHAGWLFLLFFIINYIGFNHLVNKVYIVENIKNAIEKYRRNTENPFYYVKIFPTVFYYTSLIFFGLNININNFNFSRPLGTAYIFLIYISGLVCIAYMFNYVISL